jgi:alpha-galactosidase
MWHPQEPVESAALQVASVLFSVPQISLQLDQISEEQKQMLRFYLDLWRDNRELLLEGKLALYSPEAFYSKATATLSGRELTVLYTDTTVVKGADCTTVVNCGPERRVYMDGFSGQCYKIVDCMGKEVGDGVLTELCAVTLPCAGVLFTR